MSLNRKFQDNHANPKHSDIHWNMNDVEGVRITPQLIFGTSPSILTEDPSLIRVLYKGFFHPVDCAGNADRKFFHVMENGVFRNNPIACFCLPDNYCCKGEDTIEYAFFDRGIFDKRHPFREWWCVGGAPQYFVNERKMMCCCLECWDICDLCIVCRRRRYCGERLRYSPFDRCCCCCPNKFFWLCNFWYEQNCLISKNKYIYNYELFQFSSRSECCGPKSGSPIILLEVENCLQVDQSERLKYILENARYEWEERIKYNFQVKGGGIWGGDKFQGPSTEKARRLKYQQGASKHLIDSINSKLGSFENLGSEKKRKGNGSKVLPVTSNSALPSAQDNLHGTGIVRSYDIEGGRSRMHAGDQDSPDSPYNGPIDSSNIRGTGLKPYSGFGMGPVALDVFASTGSALEASRIGNPFGSPQRNAKSMMGLYSDSPQRLSPHHSTALSPNVLSEVARNNHYYAGGPLLAVSTQQYARDGTPLPLVPVAFPPPTSSLASAAAKKVSLLSGSFNAPGHPSLKPGGSSVNLRGVPAPTALDVSNKIFGDLIGSDGEDDDGQAGQSRLTDRLTDRASGVGHRVTVSEDEIAHQKLVSTKTPISLSFTDNFLRTGSLPPVSTDYHPVFNNNKSISRNVPGFSKTKLAPIAARTDLGVEYNSLDSLDDNISALSADYQAFRPTMERVPLILHPSLLYHYCIPPAPFILVLILA